MVLCLRRICLDLPLYILFYALLIEDLLSQCTHIRGTGFSHLGISSKKWRSHATSSLYLSNAINSYSIVDMEITIYFKVFHETVDPRNVNT